MRRSRPCFASVPTSSRASSSCAPARPTCPPNSTSASWRRSSSTPRGSNGKSDRGISLGITVSVLLCPPLGCRPALAEHEDADQAGDEAGDVCDERNATARGVGGDRDRAGAEQLHHEPEAEQEDGRQLDDLEV